MTSPTSSPAANSRSRTETMASARPSGTGQPAGAPANRAPEERAEDPRQLAAQFELVQRELARVESRLAALQDAMVETQQARSTVEHLANATAASDVFVPVGAGVHVRAAIRQDVAVLMPLGAGYATEAPPRDVATALDERQNAISAQFKAASEEADRLSAAAAALSDRLAAFQS